MIAISVSTFRNNMRKYLDLSKVERVIIHCHGDETFELLPRERISEAEEFFNRPDIASRVKITEEQIATGMGKELTSEYRRELLGE